MVDTRRSKSSPPDSPTGPPAGGHGSQRTVFSLNEDETLELGRSMARGLKGGELILLNGELGLGKTVFARGIASGLGIVPEDVSSPSFTMIQEYRGGRCPMFHVDLYRLEGLEELGTLGIEEILSGGAVVVVEWGDKLPPYHRREATTVQFYDVGEGSRRIEVVRAPTEPRKRGGDA